MFDFVDFCLKRGDCLQAFDLEWIRSYIAGFQDLFKVKMTVDFRQWAFWLAAMNSMENQWLRVYMPY